MTILRLRNIALSLELAERTQIRISGDQLATKVVELLSYAHKSEDEMVNFHLQRFINTAGNDFLTFLAVAGVDLRPPVVDKQRLELKTRILNRLGFAK